MVYWNEISAIRLNVCLCLSAVHDISHTNLWRFHVSGASLCCWPAAIRYILYKRACHRAVKLHHSAIQLSRLARLLCARSLDICAPIFSKQKHLAWPIWIIYMCWAPLFSLYRLFHRRFLLVCLFVLDRSSPLHWVSFRFSGLKFIGQSS